MPSRRKGISEIVAALLLLSVTVAAFGFYYTYYVNNLSSSGGSVAQGIRDSARGTGELMSLVNYQIKDNTITLYLYNYGSQPITLNPPQQAFLVVSGSQQAAQSFALADASSGSPINTIQTQELAQLSLGFNNVPSGLFYVDLVDSIGKTFEFQLSN